MDDLALLQLRQETAFVFTGANRFSRQNDPDSSPGSRLVLAGGAAGYAYAVRDDVDAAVADRIAAILADAAPWPGHEALPACAPALIEALSPAGVVEPGPVFLLTPQAPVCGVEIVDSDTVEGATLLEHLDRNAMSPALMDAGFRSPGDLWAPWSLAMVDGEVAALAFAARLGERGAEVGVYTLQGLRGRGLAGAATAAWSAHPALGERTRFYSTSWSNVASQRVAGKLGLRRIGSTLRID